MIGKGQVCLGLQFLLSATGEKEETKDAVYEDNDIPDIPRVDTEGIPAESIVYDGEPAQKKREKRKGDTDTDDPQASGKVEKIEAQTGQKWMYFIF